MVIVANDAGGTELHGWDSAAAADKAVYALMLIRSFCGVACADAVAMATVGKGSAGSPTR